MSKESPAAAVTMLQVPQQHPSESIQNFKFLLCAKFGDNKWITSQIIQFAASALYLEKMLQLQQQCCSCSSSTLMNKFRMSNYPCVPSLVIINELFPELFNLLPLPALYLEKVLQLQQQQQQQKNFWYHNLDPHTKWGKVNEFQKKISNSLGGITKNLKGGAILAPP